MHVFFRPFVSGTYGCSCHFQVVLPRLRAAGRRANGFSTKYYELQSPPPSFSILSVFFFSEIVLFDLRSLVLSLHCAPSALAAVPPLHFGLDVHPLKLGCERSRVN